MCLSVIFYRKQLLWHCIDWLGFWKYVSFIVVLRLVVGIIIQPAIEE